MAQAKGITNTGQCYFVIFSRLIGLANSDEGLSSEEGKVCGDDEYKTNLEDQEFEKYCFM